MSVAPPLHERVYVVTGAGGGIGGATALRLLRTGASVVGVDISGKRLAATAERAADLPGTFAVKKADITVEEGAHAAIQVAIDEFETLHGLANIAGGMPNIDLGGFDIAIEDLPLDYFRATFALNVDSAFLMCKAAAPFFRERGYGKIVNTASLAAFSNYDELGNLAYNSAKAAVVSLSQAIAQLMGNDGVRCNCVAPGLVFSERVRGFVDEGYVDRHQANAALPTLATPDDLAESMAFFLEPQSDAITGELLRVAAGVR
ncbi:MAG: putative oxidoreductase [Solirubrobacterales bacterium]|nr:putative oxidoreductase [Solirubrobacterales bacterium]